MKAGVLISTSTWLLALLPAWESIAAAEAESNPSAHARASAPTMSFETADGNAVHRIPIPDIRVAYGGEHDKFGTVKGVPLHVYDAYDLCVPLEFISRMTNPPEKGEIEITFHEALSQRPITGRLDSGGRNGRTYAYTRFSAPFEVHGLRGEFKSLLKDIVNMSADSGLGNIQCFALDPSRTSRFLLRNGHMLDVEDVKWFYSYHTYKTYVGLSGHTVKGSTASSHGGVENNIFLFQGDSKLTVPLRKIKHLRLERKELDLQSRRNVDVTLRAGASISATGIFVTEHDGIKRHFHGFVGLSQLGPVFIGTHDVLEIAFPMTHEEDPLSAGCAESVSGLVAPRRPTSAVRDTETQLPPLSRQRRGGAIPCVPKPKTMRTHVNVEPKAAGDSQ